MCRFCFELYTLKKGESRVDGTGGGVKEEDDEEDVWCIEGSVQKKDARVCNA